MAASLAKLAASSRRSVAPMMARSIAPKSHPGSLSLFSTAAAPASASKLPTSPSGNEYGRSVLPTTLLPTSLTPPHHRRVADNALLKAALQDLQKKQNEDVANLQWMLDSLRIARMPSHAPAGPTNGTLNQPQQSHVYQAMNRNARKPKRANHGKRPCSRVRRRFKKRKWMNPSRRG